jgi:hypothetical protein
MPKKKKRNIRGQGRGGHLYQRKIVKEFRLPGQNCLLRSKFYLIFIGLGDSNLLGKQFYETDTLDLGGG